MIDSGQLTDRLALLPFIFLIVPKATEQELNSEPLDVFWIILNPYQQTSEN